MRIEFPSVVRALGLGLWLALPAGGELLYDPTSGVTLVHNDKRIIGVDTEHGTQRWASVFPEGTLSGPTPVLLGPNVALGLNPATGAITWRHTLENPWLKPLRQGDLIVAGPPGHLVAWRAADGQTAWELVIDKPEAVEFASDGRMAVRAEAEVLIVKPDGTLVWRKTMQTKAGTVGPYWSPDGRQVALRNGLVWVVLDAATGALTRPSDVAWLDRHAQPEAGVTRLDIDAPPDTLFAEGKDGFLTRPLGQLGRWQPLPGRPVAQVGDILLLSSGSPMPDMQMDRHGNVILDLATGMPKPKMVDGYVAMRMPGSRLLEGGPRGGVVGTHAVVNGWALYATQEIPMRAPNQPEPPNPDPILHGRQGEASWTYQGPFRPDWIEVEGQVMLVQGDRLKALDPTTGKILWTSEPLLLGDGAPQILKNENRLLVQTAAGYLHVLEAATGKSLARADVREGFLVDRRNHLVALAVLSCAIAGFIVAARRRDLYIRPIAGLKAIDNAVGRATEMGKPILYVPGLEDVDEIQTLASLSILRHVARKAAEYDTSIIVPTRKAVVMSTAQEVVKEAYTAAGRPDGYHAENIRYLTDDQFGYVVGVDGIMLRERPAANFYLGTFYAESLILAETGYATGAIQIAGTAMPSQLPFFVAACDYTLIGEELYAASAYLSRDPLQIGSLRGQDVGKAIVMLAILLGAVMITFGNDWLKVWFEA